MTSPKPAARFLFAFRIAITVACLIVIAMQFGSPEAWRRVHIVRWAPHFSGLALTLPVLFLRAWKWRTLVRTLAPTATLGEALRSYLGALPLSLITPGKAGELVRGFYLPHPETRGLRAAGLTLIDNWADFAAVACWTIPALAALGGVSAALAGAAACALLCGIPVWLRVIRSLASTLPKPWPLTAFWNRFWPEAASMSWRPSLSAIALGTLAYGLEWQQMRSFLSALGAPATRYLTLAGDMALIQWANSVQVTVAGLGLREGSTAWLLNRSGWDSQLVLVAAFLQTAVSLLFPAIIGLFIKPLMPMPEWKWPRSRKPEAEPVLLESPPE